MKKFTLIELIIVIAIIGVLVTLLLPSLSRARYLAKLAVCKSNLAQISRINMVYATSNNHFFPNRLAPKNGIGGFGVPYAISTGNTNDFELFEDLGFLNIKCPLSNWKKLPRKPTTRKGHMRYSYPESRYSYSMYYGWDASYNGATGTHLAPELKLLRSTDNFTFKGEEIDVAASDVVMFRYSGYWNSSDAATASHMGNYDATENIDKVNPLNKFKQDTNYARRDGSVFMINNVIFEDPRLMKLPYEETAYRRYQNDYLFVPKKQ